MVTRLIILLALIALLVGGCVWQEQRVSIARTERKQALDAKAAAIAERDSARASTKTVVEYVDRVQIVREAGATITREIPIYVTQKADAACAIPAGFVRLHDAAATGNPAGPPAGDPDAPAAGITLSGIAGTVADNYTSCHATAAQLSSLQDWIDLHAPEPAP
ncbi:Lipoprotein [Xanthomonas citri pv. citri]|uniref:Lipoprotein n=1 Tax=Xanthomonas citri pv. citri TaxID=611301 RepID=A0A0U5F9Q6_XANCI|nr:Lipoprotein [Xanthomonas citri pv. citri]